MRELLGRKELRRCGGARRSLRSVVDLFIVYWWICRRWFCPRTLFKSHVRLNFLQ
jgi:hypothetical protein